MTTKTCIKCKEGKPLTPEYWYFSKGEVKGNTCKECVKVGQREYYRRPETKARIEEYRARPETKERLRAWGKEYYKKPEVQARARKRQQSPEYKAWREEYSERPEIRARLTEQAKVRDRRSDQRERRRLYDRSVRGRAARAVKRANKQAGKYEVPGRLTTNDVVELWEKYPTCLSCGQGRGLDHVVPLSEGGSNTPDNLQTLCHSCNSDKGKYTIDYRPNRKEAQ